MLQISETDVSHLLTGRWLTDVSQFVAHYFQQFQNVNWLGFYFSDGDKLHLGPFQGKPACTEIPFDRGVCGAAFSRREVMIIDDVHTFPGHIACDADSRSELVIPFYVEGELIGVLDIDSPVVGRFSPTDADILTAGLTELAKRNPSLKQLSSLLAK